MQRYSSVTLHVSPKNPISAEKLKITFSKIQILPQNFFPEWFGPKQIEAIRFRNGFHEKSAQTDCSKEMWILNAKGLKHLNSVVCLFLLFCSPSITKDMVKKRIPKFSCEKLIWLFCSFTRSLVVWLLIYLERKKLSITSFLCERDFCLLR